MPKIVRVWLRRLTVLAVLALAVWGAVAVVRVCRAPRPRQGFVAQLRVRRQNLYSTVHDEQARLLVEVTNEAARRSPPCRLRARVWSHGGNQRGYGTLTVPPLAPGEQRVLGMRVPVHRGVKTKEITFDFLPTG